MKYLFLAVFGFASVLAHGQQIDTEASQVSFSIKNMGFRKVKGTFSGLQGTLNFEPNAVSEAFFNVCIDAGSIDTKNKKRDEHLRNEDFFHTKVYPTICFESSSVTKKGDTFETSGMLTMHGFSEPVTIPFKYDADKQLLSGSFTLKRLDYEVGVGTSTFLVGDEVDVQIDCRLTP